MKQVASEKHRAMPDYYSSTEDAHRRKHLPKSALQYARDNGCAAFHESGRVNSEVVHQFLFDILNRIFSGDPEHLAASGFEGVGGIDFQRERNLRLAANEKERDEAIANERIHDLGECEQMIRRELLQPLRDGLQGLVKKFSRHKESPEIAVEILTVDLANLVEQVRQQCEREPE